MAGLSCLRAGSSPQPTASEEGFTWDWENTTFQPKMTWRLNWGSHRPSSTRDTTRRLLTMTSQCWGTYINHTNYWDYHRYYNKYNVCLISRLPSYAKQLPNLGVACLPKPRQALPVHKLCTIIGWGKRRSTDVYGAELLHEAQVIPRNSASIFHNFFPVNVSCVRFIISLTYSYVKHVKRDVGIFPLLFSTRLFKTSLTPVEFSRGLIFFK